MKLFQKKYQCKNNGVTYLPLGFFSAKKKGMHLHFLRNLLGERCKGTGKGGSREDNAIRLCAGILGICYVKRRQVFVIVTPCLAHSAECELQ